MPPHGKKLRHQVSDVQPLDTSDHVTDSTIQHDRQHGSGAGDKRPEPSWQSSKAETTESPAHGRSPNDPVTDTNPLRTPFLRSGKERAEAPGAPAAIADHWPVQPSQHPGGEHKPRTGNHGKPLFHTMSFFLEKWSSTLTLPSIGIAQQPSRRHGHVGKI